MATVIKSERIPPLNPFRFVPANDVLQANVNTWSPDRGFFYQQRRQWEYGNMYIQKRNYDDQIDLYIDTLAGAIVVWMYDDTGNLVATSLPIGITGGAVAGNSYNYGGIDYPYNSIYLSIKLSEIYAMVPNQQIFLFAIECLYGDPGDVGNRWYVSEPVFFRKTGWPKTMLIEATHPISKFGVMFEAFPTYRSAERLGVWFRHRVEAAIINDPPPAFNDTAFQDQGFQNRVLDSTPYRLFDFVAGLDSGVPKYMLDKVNCALSCKTFFIDGVQYSKDNGANWSMVVAAGYNKYSGKIRLQEYDHYSGCEYGIAAYPFRWHDDYHDSFHD